MPSVMVSLAEPPRMLSTLETVAVLAKSPKVSVSPPAPRSIETLETCVPKVIVSAPSRRSASRRSRPSRCWRSRRASGCRCRRRGRCWSELERAAPSVIVSAAEPPTSVSTLETVSGVGEVAERQRVVAVAEVDRGLRDLSVDSVIVSAADAADERLDVGDRARVGRVRRGSACRCREPRSMLLELDESRAERERVGAGAADQRLDVRDRWPTLAKSPRVSLSVPEPRSIVTFDASGAERDGIVRRAADDALDVGDGRRVGEVAEGHACPCRRRGRSRRSRPASRT